MLQTIFYSHWILPIKSLWRKKSLACPVLLEASHCTSCPRCLFQAWLAILHRHGWNSNAAGAYGDIGNTLGIQWDYCGIVILKW